MEDRRISTYISKRLCISQERPKQDDFGTKHNRCRILRDNLALFEANSSNFWKRFVTMDETWVHHYQPETKGSQNNESICHQSQRRRRSHPLLARSWSQFSGMRKENYWWTTSRWVVLSMDNIVYYPLI